MYREAKGLAWNKDTITISTNSHDTSIVFGGDTRVSVMPSVRAGMFNGSSSSFTSEVEAAHIDAGSSRGSGAAENEINDLKKHALFQLSSHSSANVV